MKPGGMSRRLLSVRFAALVPAVLLAVLVLAACTVVPQASWPQFRHDAAGSGTAPGETAISPANVGSLVVDFEADLGTHWAELIPVVANGRVYVVVGNQLKVFDAAGVGQCTVGGPPKTCEPLFTAPLFGDWVDTSAAVAGGAVYVSTSRYNNQTGAVTGRLEVFDASGVTNCGGAPVVCAPLWTSSGNTVTIYHPIVDNGFVYSADDASRLAAFDASGVVNCGGSPKTCDPVWVSSIVLGHPQIAVDGQVLVAARAFSAGLFAFDPHGQVGCSGTPKVCEPLWQSAVGASSQHYPSLSGGRVYLPTGNGLRVFDAAGSLGCSGSPVTCEPLWIGSNFWSSPPGVGPAVAGGRVFARNGSDFGTGNILVYDTNPSNCSGSPPNCPLLWQTLGINAKQPTIANGVLLAGGKAFDTSAPKNCSFDGSPYEETCAIEGFHGGQYTAVVGGRVYTVMDSTTTPGNAVLKAFRLP